MQRVVCFGSAVMDIVMKSKDFRVLKSHQVQGGVAICEVYGGKMGVEEMTVNSGGAGTNVAVGLSRLGLIPASVCRVGDDLFGKQILNDLSLEKVEASLVQVAEGGQTAVSVVLVAADGGRSIMTYRGVSKELKKEEIDWGKVEKAKWIHVAALGGDLALLEDILAFASSKNIRISWNPGKGEIEQRERAQRLAKKVEVLIVNRLEAAMILGKDIGEEQDLTKGLASLGVKQIVMTDGKKGVVWIEPGRVVKMKAFEVKSVDDTGAGDAFCAGLVAGLVNKQKAEVAIKMGMANGASEVTELGVKKGLLRKKGMEKWLKKEVETEETRI